MYRGAASAVLRFPVTTIAAITACVAAMWIVEDGKQEATRLLMTTHLAIPLFLACETWTKNTALRLISLLLASGALALYYINLDLASRDFYFKAVNTFAVLMLSAHLTVAVVPFLDSRSISAFWNYNIALLGNWLTGAAYALVLFLSLALALLAVDTLFALDLNNKVYLHLFMLLGFGFISLYFLNQMPEESALQTEQKPFGPAFSVLIKFILVPVVILYAVILTAYLLKIMLSGNLPQGFVGNLVLGFAAVGILTYLLNFRLPEFDEGLLPRGFKKWFWWALLPSTVLMLVSIGRRISDYGITESRYLVATIGVWLMSMSVYFILSKKDNIKTIPASLIPIALFSVLGPFSAFRVSERSQLNELQSLLEPSGRWVNNQLSQGDGPMEKDAAQRVSSILNFFEKRDRMHLLEQRHMPFPLDSLPDKGETTSTPYALEKWLGIKQSTQQDRNFLFIYGHKSTDTTPLPPVDISAYSAYYVLNQYTDQEAVRNPGGTKWFRIVPGTLTLEYGTGPSDAFQVIEGFDFQPVLDTCFRQRDDSDDNTQLFVNPSIPIAGKRHDLLLHIHDIHLEYDQDNKPEIVSINTGIFIRPKTK
jgi:hypothetical protein